MNRRGTAFLFQGYPGAGKGTAAKNHIQNAREHSVFYIETGAIIRAKCKADSDFASKWEVVCKGGDFLPCPVMKELVNEQLNSFPQNADVILDGYPRTLAQAQYVVPLLHNVMQYNVVTLALSVSKDVAVKRIVDRLLKKGNRDDDANPEVVKKRLKKFDDEFMTIKPYLDRYTTYVEVRADDPEPVVCSQVSSHLLAYSATR